MKYWGKKPHNIWGEYIEKYTDKGDYILDPFVGSGMTYFESVKRNRIPITIDLNPISDFSIKCLTRRDVDYAHLKEEAERIIQEIKNADYYKKEYTCICSSCGKITDIYNYKTNGKVTISYKCNECGKTNTDIIEPKDQEYLIDKWVPHKKLSDLKSITEGFIKNIGTDDISSIWSNRNLKILSEIYDKILSINCEECRQLLVFAFIQSLHLTSKMCIPRNEKSNRPLSTSWGRPAYMISKKIFEQNPVLSFEKNVFKSTGVIEGLKSSETYIGNNIDKRAKHILGDSLEVLKTINDKTVDLVITDPPYGNIIQYCDLSEVWVSWLEKYDQNYKIRHEKEIIINKEKNQEEYEKDLTAVFKEINRILKNDKKFIITFNSNSADDWISLLNSIKKSGFHVTDLLFQKNKRSSEANVSAKEGIAISDYYIICEKGKWDIEDIRNYLNKEILQNG